jgi:phosphatidylinositol alpha-1,6-mannosyltransferase
MCGMRVWILTEDFPPKRGGISRWAWSTASTLRDLGHHVTVLAKRSGIAAAPGMRLVSVEGRSFCALRHIHFARSIRRELRSSPGPDVILASTWRTAEGAILSGAGCPVHAAVHGLEVFTRYTLLLRVRRKRVLRRSDRILAASRFTADQVLRIVPGARVSAGLNGVDTGFFTPDGPSAAKPCPVQILSAGRLVPRKRFDLVLDLVDALSSAGIQAGAWIAGTGPLRGELERMAAELGIRVVFCGDVEDDELLRLYRGADLFASPCMSDPATGDVEGFGITFLEAAACGTAAAGLAEGGVVDAVEDGVSGILTGREDFVRRAVDLCMNPAELSRLGAGGRARALDLFDLKKVVPELVRTVVEG